MNVRNSGETIKVLPETKRKLKILKANLDMRSYDELINFLIKKYYEKTRIEM